MKLIKGVLLFLLLWQIQIQGAEVTRLISSEKLNHWYLTLETTHPVRYHYFLLKNPDRFVIDLSNSIIGKQFHPESRADSPITGVRFAHHQQQLRLVFDLKAPMHIHVTDRVTSDNRYEIILECPAGLSASASASPSVPTVSTSISPQAEPQLETKPESKPEPELEPKYTVTKTRSWRFSPKPVVTAVENSGARPVLVVIDPGHGGKDPGAVGIGGTAEKNVVLSIALDLQNIINQQKGFKAVLTRNDDYYLTLRDRLAIARQDKADMFVAIHADMYRNHTAQGVSVFALSQRGATSEAARWLADQENQSELLGGADLADKGYILKSVLLDLSQSATIQASLDIGQEMIQALRGVARLHHGRVEQAAFVVLKSPDIPSLLVETGFLSNFYEEKNLKNSNYRHHIALAIFQGLTQYFTAQPPQGTWLALQKH